MIDNYELILESFDKNKLSKFLLFLYNKTKELIPVTELDIEKEALIYGINSFVASTIKSSKIFDKSLIKSRMIKLLKGNQIYEIPNLLAFAFGNQLKLNKKGKGLLDKLLTEYKPDIVILDSMVRFIEGDEDRSLDVKNNTGVLKFLTNKHNCSFLVLHHTTKRKPGSKHSLRGSGEFSAFVDLLIMVSGTVNLKLKQEKNRYDGAVEIGGFELIDCENNGLKVVSIEIDKNTKTKFEQSKEIIPKWISEKKVSQKVSFNDIWKYMESKGFKRSLISKALKTISEEGILVKHKHGIYEIPKSN